MLGMILRSGSTPIVKDENDSGEVVSLDKVLQRSSGPVVVFPEVSFEELDLWTRERERERYF